MIVLSHLLNIVYPQNAEEFYSSAVVFASVDIMDGSGLYREYINMTKTEPISQKFVDMDIQDKNFVYNSGSFFIMIMILICQPLL